MRSVKMPQTVMTAVVLCLFAAVLYGLRQYGTFGSTGHGILALAAGMVCLALVGGLIYANYETYPPARRKDPYINGTCH